MKKRRKVSRPWGVFEKPGYVHVAPCDSDGFVAPGHKLDERCNCSPQQERQVNGLCLVVHHTEN